MMRMSRRLVLTAVVLAVLAAGAGRVHAQTVYYPPAPVVVAPVTTYYAPAPPVAVTYYAPPPVVAAYPPSVSVTTYRYGLLPRRAVTITAYGPPPPPVPLPAPPLPRFAGYYAPVVVYP
jgi:hypothetical protein